MRVLRVTRRTKSSRISATGLASDCVTFFVIGRQDTVSNPSLTLAGNGYPAQPPRVQNFDAAQAVDAGRDFTLLWDPLADGTTNDVVFVSVRRASDQAAVFNTPFLKGQGTLDGTATSNQHV